jgi:hypothetical protein
VIPLAEFAAAVLVILAAALAVDRTMIQRSHWPLAAALCLAMLEPLRPDAGPVAKVVCIGIPALSAWLTVRVLARSDLLASCAFMLVLAVGSWRFDDWAAAPTWALTTSVIVQALAVLAVAPRRRMRLADRCVLVLFAGDVAALLGPAGESAAPPVQQAAWWIVQWQAAAVALALCLLHVAAELAERRRHG